MPLEWKKTGRGFLYAEFRDQYDFTCSLQESSLATEAAIWLGVNGTNRMHLTRGLVAALLPSLQRFALTGSLQGEGEEPTTEIMALLAILADEGRVIQGDDVQYYCVHCGATAGDISEGGVQHLDSCVVIQAQRILEKESKK